MKDHLRVVFCCKICYNEVMEKSKKDKEFEKFAHKVYDKYKKKLLIENSNFSIRKISKEEHPYLAMQFAYPYLELQILYTDEPVKEFNEFPIEVERKLVHELCHFITDPLYAVSTNFYKSKSEIEDQRERLTDHIAMIAFKNI